ncbi:MAG: SLBB domain-containing protein [Anaeromicrobium sp.]|jgi:NADH-quinone oxidoreductase subunit F|uniref:complex I 51 kDa subunit family protein n=1 Tax=Anaeromicrobium sp. TaxID=1929132 RepID=UPI0025D36185|nr:NADH-ubiquinone oxidoreductase-F iron-sulfur binding region domain-containing protein [Anaeromicrobium sp.]MCT4595206.1 SLBB domain-containing protein [Anaeromicrobium sp.]
MNRVQKLITENFDKYHYKNIDEYIEIGGFHALKKAIHNGADYVISQIKLSGLRGRGGAAFPTWKKWHIGHNRKADRKFVFCNADEGEPGTFKDRELLKKDPYKIIEGMTISAFVNGANEGYIYIREEYSYLHDNFREAIEIAENHGYLGKDILNSGFDFSIKVFSGAGAYVCGENSSMIESMEGKAGRPRIKPPRIGEVGYLNKPTLVNNVETLACVTTILKHGAEEYARYGTESSTGTKIISLCGNIKRPGVYEIPFGITLKEIIYDVGGGVEKDGKVKFLQLGGASGAILPRDLLETKYSYEDLDANGFPIGSGSILVADETQSIVKFLEAIEDFFYHESCGKCTPCREGKRQISKILRKISAGEGTMDDLNNIEKIANVMKHASFCGLGQTAPTALLSAIKYFSPELCSNIDGIRVTY